MTAALLLATRCALATWTGFVGSHPATCQLCTTVIEEAVNLASIRGRCHIPHFGRHRVLAVGLVSMQGASGALCRPHRRVTHGRIPPCPPPPTPCPLPPPPRWCCALMPASASFDVDHPPTTVDGTYVCPKESGIFSLSR